MAFHEQPLISKAVLVYKLVKSISTWNFNQRSPLTLLFFCISVASRGWSPVEAQHSPQQQSIPCKSPPVLWAPAAAVFTYTRQHQHLLEWGKPTKQEMECFLSEIKKKGNLLLVKGLLVKGLPAACSPFLLCNPSEDCAHSALMYLQFWHKVHWVQWKRTSRRLHSKPH